MNYTERYYLNYPFIGNKKLFFYLFKQTKSLIDLRYNVIFQYITRLSSFKIIT